LREIKDVTQQEVADAIGVYRELYVRYENGTRKPPYPNIIKLADYYGVSTDYLFGREMSIENCVPRTKEKQDFIDLIENLPDSTVNQLLKIARDVLRMQEQQTEQNSHQ